MSSGAGRGWRDRFGVDGRFGSWLPLCLHGANDDISQHVAAELPSF